MKNCREVTRLLSEANERPLRPGERIGLRLHLMMCSACRNFGRQVSSLRDISRAYARGRFPGDGERDGGQEGAEPPGKGPDDCCR